MSPELTLVLQYGADPEFEDLSVECPACQGIVPALDVALVVDACEPLCCRQCGVMLAA